MMLQDEEDNLRSIFNGGATQQFFPICYSVLHDTIRKEKRRNMRNNKFVLGTFVVFVVLATVLSACGPAPTPAPTAAPTQAPVVTDAPTAAPTEAPTVAVDPMAELVAAAQAEGTLTTIALPHDWCNYGEAIDAFKAKYGLSVNELLPDGSSGEEIEAIKANMGNTGPQAPDVVDVGLAFGPSSVAEGLFMPYKVSTWDSIPDAAKDADGYWYGDYFGVMGFQVNTDVATSVPADWADLLKPEFNGQVAMSGDPRLSNQAISAVAAAALANGGSLDNVQPGLEYFKAMNDAGNLVPLIGNNGLVAKGEISVRLTWDYNGLAGNDGFAGNPKATFVIPKTGLLAGMYIQAISAYAPHPNAAKLWMEFLYSDEGQTYWMKGYCHPIREADMRARGVIPADLLAKLPDVTGAVFPSLDQITAYATVITTNWDSVVGANIQAAP
jgi:putative spermidine/putrescine transport system substrate-binding protein